MGLATLTGRHPADHPGAVGDSLLGMEGALLAGDPLADNSCVPVDQDRHAVPTLPAHCWAAS